ncbi:MAG: hypothetical protein U0230_21800 [Polyangiales bacterium]
MSLFFPRPRAVPGRFLASFLASTALFLAGCDNVDDGTRPEAYSADTYGLANGCYAIDAAAPGRDTGRLLVSVGDGSRFSFHGREVETAAKLYLKPADLETYVLRDAEGRYLVAGEGGTLDRAQTLESDITRNEDGFVSPALWKVRPVASMPGRFYLQNAASSKYLGVHGIVDGQGDAARIAFYETSGCKDFPELTVDATGTPTRTRFADGDLFGFVDAHEHMFSNLAFGAGGIFHGAPFHPLGVEHALSDCSQFHGEDGKSDLIGYFYGGAPFSIEIGAAALLNGDIGMFNHHTDGYPTFTDWPRSWGSATHQTMYYRWLERAWLGGLRLMVQHVTSNQVLCELGAGVGTQPNRISCNEMVSADRIISAAYALERYIDAQAGGPGKGWFRIVTTPADARRVIGEGKLAVILGIETSNVLDCFVRAREGFPACTPEIVRERLDQWYARGVRAMFPVHKFDNGFSAGDGMRGFIEIGNVANTGYYEDFTNVGCPDVPAVFDHGPVQFGGMNMPRAQYDGDPPIDTSQFASYPLSIFGPNLNNLQKPALPGEWCQAHGLTPVGETLIREMMRRGMIIEVDHLPKKAYARAYEMLHQYDYPAAGTHGSDNRGDLYTLGGISTTGLPRCQDPSNPDVAAGFRNRIASIAANGGYPAQGFGFDFNGFAGGPRPRFGVDAGCGPGQTNGITYPFTSFGGDVTFQPPQLGERSVDFDQEGMIHIGLVPELVQDARNMGMSDADLEPLFRSAEGYIRMWERAEARAAALQSVLP